MCVIGTPLLTANFWSSSCRSSLISNRISIKKPPFLEGLSNNCDYVKCLLNMNLQLYEANPNAIILVENFDDVHYYFFRGFGI